MIKPGDKVYIACTVNKIPNEADHLYRLVTEKEGTVVWATEDEIRQIPTEVENSFDILKGES